MTYAKQIAQAAMLATMRQLGVLDEEMPDVADTIDLDAIIASVPKHDNDAPKSSCRDPLIVKNCIAYLP